MKAIAPNDFVVAVAFSSMFDAELAASKLKGAGIPTSISADDLGGMRPHLQLTQGVRVLVPSHSARLARRLLEVRDK